MKVRKLNLPLYKFKIEKRDERYFIYDSFRSQFVVLTPEEWVRQNFLRFCVEERKFPASLTKVEMKIKLDSVSKRCDAVTFDRNLKPLVIFEFKSPEVELDKNTFRQISTYNYAVGSKYLAISNGLKHHFLIRDQIHQQYKPYSDIPDFEDLI